VNTEPDPTRTDSRCVLPVGNGHLVLSGWPGLRITPAGGAWIDPEATATTLADFHELDVTVLVGLCEPTDLPPEAISQLRDWSRQHSLRLVHAPIRDGAPCPIVCTARSKPALRLRWPVPTEPDAAARSPRCCWPNTAGPCRTPFAGCAQASRQP